MNFDAVKSVLIAEAERLGLQEYDVFFMESESRSTETLKDEISSFSSSRGGGVGFRCVVNGNMGCASTELLCEEEMEALVARAAANATMLESRDEPIIFEGSAHYDTPTAVVADAPTTEDMKSLALSLQRDTYAQNEYIADGTQSGVFCERVSMAFLNSKGLNLSHTAGVGGAYVQSVVSREGESQAAFDFSVLTDKEKLSSLPKTVTKEAMATLGATEIASGKYDVILSGKQMRAMLSAFASAFSGKNAQLGLSLLKGKEGERIAADCVTLIDDPMYEGSPMQLPFDGEGVATYRKSVIENGVLQTLLYDLSTAKRAGRETTGNGQRGSYSDPVSISPYHFYLASGTESEEELMGRMGNGLYITELKGLHAGANAVTGDFSIESAGFMVRDGRRAEAIRSFTIAGNFFDFIKEIEALSDTVHLGMPSGFTVFGSPDVLVRGVSVAGK